MVSALLNSPNQLSVLEKGLNFTPTHNKDITKDVIVSLESILHKFSSQDKEIVRSTITTTLNKPRKRRRRNLHKDEYIALKQLRSEKSIVILKADKGNCTVIMDRTAYDSKCYLTQTLTGYLRKTQHQHSRDP